MHPLVVLLGLISGTAIIGYLLRNKIPAKYSKFNVFKKYESQFGVFALVVTILAAIIAPFRVPGVEQKIGVLILALGTVTLISANYKEFLADFFGVDLYEQTWSPVLGWPIVIAGAVVTIPFHFLVDIGAVAAILIGAVLLGRKAKKQIQVDAPVSGSTRVHRNEQQEERVVK